MKEVPVVIVRYVSNEPQPGIVECSLTDAHGKVHTFVEKTAIVSSHDLFSHSAYPQPGLVACEIEETWADESGRTLARINTNPWGVESVEGETTFVVPMSLIRQDA